MLVTLNSHPLKKYVKKVMQSKQPNKEMLVNHLPFLCESWNFQICLQIPATILTFFFRLPGGITTMMHYFIVILSSLKT